MRGPNQDPRDALGFRIAYSGQLALYVKVTQRSLIFGDGDSQKGRSVEVSDSFPCTTRPPKDSTVLHFF